MSNATAVVPTTSAVAAVPTTEELTKLAGRWAVLKTFIDEARAESDRIRAIFKTVLEDGEKAVYGPFEVAVGHYVREQLNQAALKEAFPGLFEEYREPVTCNTFNVKKVEADETALTK